MQGEGTEEEYEAIVVIDKLAKIGLDGVKTELKNKGFDPSILDKVQKNEHTKEDTKKLQDLNSYRSQLKNAINEELGGRVEVKV